MSTKYAGQHRRRPRGRHRPLPQARRVIPVDVPDDQLADAPPVQVVSVSVPVVVPAGQLVPAWLPEADREQEARLWG